MSKNVEAQKIYLDGYEAFEQGDFRRANELADTCLASSSQTSYWYAGALGLKCWVANFTNNLAELEQTAETLLSMDTGTDKPWFDGVALLNLGLAKRKDGQSSEAQTLFLRAAERYKAQELQPGQPGEWENVIDYFSTLCRWAATEETVEWRSILERFGDDTSEQSELLRQLSAAAQIMLRYSEGEEVKRETIELVKEGVSRTFLSVLLLE
jgi:tetratricopeptide (TPR) repeat protein